MKIAGRGRRDASAIGGHWLLSFRKREAQRNLLTAGTIGSQGGIKRALSDCNRHNPPPEPTLPAVSRFLCASRFRNDKRETALKANSQRYFGCIATIFGGAGDPSGFLNVLGICNTSAPAVRSSLSRVFTPPTPSQSVLPSLVSAPLRPSVAPAGRGVSVPDAPRAAARKFFFAPRVATTREPFPAPTNGRAGKNTQAEHVG